MNSMTTRLFGLLLIATGLVWICGIAWIYSSTRQELERVLDARLEEATKMVGSLIENADVKVVSGVSGVRMPRQMSAIDHVETNFQLACQVWSIGGQLVGKSSHAPETQLTHVSSGFSNQDINGARWRVYAQEDHARGIRVLVGDSINHRERLVRELVRGLVIPGAVVFVILSGLIWLALREGLGPLRRLTFAVASRGADDLSAIEIERTPTEIRPVVDALNGLFAKVVSAREHERSVTAYAAHELRTPLAGLRTQMQVALAAGDPATRDAALKNAVVSVDRMTRMARQLLALARIESAAEQAPQEWIDAGERLAAISDELRTKERPSPAVVEKNLFGFKIRVDPEAFHVAARNLTENAIQHTPDGEPVLWSLSLSPGEAALVLDDNGPGIPPEEIGLVTQRFFRGRYKTPIGSGLGLAIAKTALEKDGLAMRLADRGTPSGLRAEIILDRSRVAAQAA